jgi:hypothetical protein
MAGAPSPSIDANSRETCIGDQPVTTGRGPHAAQRKGAAEAAPYATPPQQMVSSSHPACCCKSTGNLTSLNS